MTSGDGVTWKNGPLLASSYATITGSAFGRSWGVRTNQTTIHAGYNPFDVRANDQTGIGLDPNITFISQLPNGNVLAVRSNIQGSSMQVRASGASSWTTATFPLGVHSGTKFAALGNRWFSGVGTASASLIYTSANGSTWTSTLLNGSNTHFTSLPGKSWMVYQSQYYPYPTIAAWNTDINNARGWVSLTTTGIPANNRGDFVKRVVAHEGRLVLLGADENIYFSENGQNWFLGPTPGKVVDIAAANGQLVAILKNGGIVQAGSPHPGGGAPIISIRSPQSASTHLVGSTVTIEGEVSDPEEGVASYECYQDATLLASGTGKSFRFTATMLDPNGHTITVWARDSHGLRQMDSVRLHAVAPELPNLLAQGEGKSYLPHSFAVTHDGVFYTAGTRTVYRSIDGVMWHRVPIPSFTGQISGMASGNGSLVIQFGGGFITTRDGVNWTHFSPNSVNFSPNLPVRFESGVFTATYNGVNSTGGVMVSADGLRWKISDSSDPGRLAWSANSLGGTIIGVREFPTNPSTFRSTDGGYNWIPIVQLGGASGNNSRGIFEGGKFIVAISGSVNKLFTSQDAVSWAEQSLPTGLTGLPAIGQIGGRYFLGGAAAFQHVSEDAFSWQPISRSMDRQKIAYLTGLFVAHSSTHGLHSSRDGITWTPIPGTPTQVSKILANESVFVVIDGNGGVWTSPDGDRWTKEIPGFAAVTSFTGTGRSVAQLGETIVVAGGGLLVASKDNGQSWMNTTVIARNLLWG